MPTSTSPSWHWNSGDSHELGTITLRLKSQKLEIKIEPHLQKETPDFDIGTSVLAPQHHHRYYDRFHINMSIPTLTPRHFNKVIHNFSSNLKV